MKSRHGKKSSTSKSILFGISILLHVRSFWLLTNLKKGSFFSLNINMFRKNMYVYIAFMTFLSCYIILNSYWAHLCCKWLFCCMHYNLQSQLSWPNVYITFIHVVLTTNNIDVVMVLSTTYECLLLLLFSRNYFMFVENMIFLFTET